VVYDRLGDRVKHWATLNEPWCTAFHGYGTGQHAPGLCDYSKAYQATHHLLMAHGRSVQVFRQGNTGGEIGIVLNPQWFIPASDRQADIDARQRVYEENTALFLDPLYCKKYPEYLFSTLGKHHPQIEAGDMDLIAEPTDYLGVNYYMTFMVNHDVDVPVIKADGTMISDPGFGRTTMNWGIAPSGMTRMLENIHNTYSPAKIYITENGTALADAPDENGYVADWGRISFIREHLRAILKARETGANVQGYFQWSLMDNFEWARGYMPRFGMVRVDYETGKRTPKASALWYRDLIATNGQSL
jgi:beta-glucosidase